MTVYIGIDWSEAKHDAIFLDEKGQVLVHVVLPHTLQGLLKLERTRDKLGVSVSECVVGLETAHNLIIDFLWEQGYPKIYVTPPQVIKSSQGRYRQSGARDDHRDAQVIADVVRTDQARLQPWHPDGVLTRQLQTRVSLINYLTRTITRTSNRLRAILLRYYPTGLTIFSSLTTQIALHFLQAYPTPMAAAKLTRAEFEQFLNHHHYRHKGQLAKRFAKLQQPYPKATPETVLVYCDQVPFMVQTLLTHVQAKNQQLTLLSKVFEKHPDQAIFASLPGAGTFLAPALLSKFGDDRQRFPAPASVQALAGTCPITVRSGKRKVIKFRNACDKEFRHIAQQWASASLKSSAWANTYWSQIREQTKSDNHAYRCLANRWLAIAWKLWQSHQTYDEEFHLKQRAKRNQPK